MRHTAALRLVDAGASEEELAAFMGHTDLNTGLVYFNSSRSQAERINQALGVSNTYQNVLKIAYGRFISSHELAGLKGDQQIAGVPHGMPIAGIGGCELGQPSCPNNPVMSCYGCSRFMPITSARIHLQVLEDLREVMKFFYVSSHAERGSPALQLESTIAKVQAVIDELGGPAEWTLNLEAFIRDAQAIAEERGVRWNIELGSDGVAPKGARLESYPDGARVAASNRLAQRLRHGPGDRGGSECEPGYWPCSQPTRRSLCLPPGRI